MWSQEFVHCAPSNCVQVKLVRTSICFNCVKALWGIAVIRLNVRFSTDRSTVSTVVCNDFAWALLMNALRVWQKLVFIWLVQNQVHYQWQLTKIPSFFLVLPIFQVVRFPNDVCAGSSRNGTCYTGKYYT